VAKPIFHFTFNINRCITFIKLNMVILIQKHALEKSGGEKNRQKSEKNAKKLKRSENPDKSGLNMVILIQKRARLALSPP